MGCALESTPVALESGCGLQGLDEQSVLVDDSGAYLEVGVDLVPRWVLQGCSI